MTWYLPRCCTYCLSVDCVSVSALHFGWHFWALSFPSLLFCSFFSVIVITYSSWTMAGRLFLYLFFIPTYTLGVLIASIKTDLILLCCLRPAWR
ncbi:hypothetical protein BDW74DRAFT_141916 [Aspergillus multicolor]|uniref:uncharacterized protein n=1 Tax=Aspergillus multicolor TaxID=41759 RepID=UPI003CCE0A97